MHNRIARGMSSSPPLRRSLSRHATESSDMTREDIQSSDFDLLSEPIELRDFLTFERTISRKLTLLIYWAGLGLIALVGFAATGVAVGVALRGEGLEALLAIPAFVVGALVVGALLLLWRGASEFYVAIFRLGDDLRRLRELAEADKGDEAS